MKVEGIPNNGCNYFNNNYGFTNYNAGTATTYVIIEGKAIATRRQTYTSIPTGYICINANDIKYKPEYEVSMIFMSIVLCSLIGVLLWKTIGRIIGR